jgi:hypothetical protein
MNRRFIANSTGSVAISTALLLVLLIGLTGLAVEVASWYQTKRSMQGTADAAAISAGWSLTSTGSCSSGGSCSWDPGSHGLAVASENGWTTTATNGVRVTVVSPPTLTSSPFYNDPTAVEVWITQPQHILFGAVDAIVAPTIGVHAIVKPQVTITNQGSACVLALANADDAIYIHGSKAGITASCGIAVDGGIDQYRASPSNNCASDGPPCGDITFNSSGAFIDVAFLAVATPSLKDVEASCGTTPPTQCTDIKTGNSLASQNLIYPNTATQDPYWQRIFTRPGSVVTGVAVNKGGSGYSDGTHTFTVIGGSGPPATFTATVKNGKVTSTGAILDPGSYGTLPSGSVSATPDSGGGSGATFTLTTGDCTNALPSPPVPGRAYCSISFSNGNANHFPAGIYYIEGGNFGITGSNTIVCSDDYYNLPGQPNQCWDPTQGTPTPTTPFNGVTFVFTKTPTGNSYATLGANSGTIELTGPVLGQPINADGSLCTSGSCANTTDQIVFFQDRAAPVATSASSCGGSTSNCLGGNGARTISGSLYFPSQTVTFTGSSNIGGTCFGVVAKYVDVGGTPTFANGCLPGTQHGGQTIVTGSTLSE